MTRDNAGMRRGWLATARERVAWRHPEWWVLAMSAAAWVVMAVPGTAAIPTSHHGHAAPSWLDASGGIVSARDWLLMIVAMMFPLCIASIQATAARSLWRRRHRAIASWLIGYVAPWLMLGLVVSFSTATLWPSGPQPSGAIVAVAFVVAAVWQGASLRARVVRRCHRTQPLAPSGWRATRDCMRYGWTTGIHCVVACGALMIACSLAGHGALGLFCMVAATFVGLAERYMIRPDERWLAGAVALQAIVAAFAFPW